MKKKLTLGLAATVLTAATVLSLATPAKADTQTPEARAQLFRMYNPNSGEHLYTPVGWECVELQSKGWMSEGMAAYIPYVAVNQWQGPIVARVYNPNTDDHFYSSSSAEIRHLVNLGWHNDGFNFEFPAASKTAKDAKPVYRLYNPNAKGAGSHFFTMNSYERNQLIKAGWKNENIAWYAFSKAQ